ncbi:MULTISPECIES: ATP-binding protein [unclassified Modicisalibacter]|uniref:ATP-binding protein n=1 Tax=unclassified Modicisalibacter TaxID=2679913 RepID=UPI001CCB59F5|nr:MULTISPECIES: ATP-binding protein [unclassified Modicisalibacter]MBZ9556596.1 response regulator [Modicisalibacter sp. R2A 31.J]MBZ9574935.1 response regulator [Modicisalibacter sp. MOD 31.J]
MSLWFRLIVASLAMPLLALALLGGWQLYATDTWRRDALVTRVTQAVELVRPELVAASRDERLDSLLGRLEALDGVAAVALDPAPPASAATGLHRDAGRWHVRLALPGSPPASSAPLWLDVTLRQGVLALPFYRQLSELALTLLGAALILGSAALLLPRRLFATLQAQRDVLQRVASGDHDARLPASPFRELDDTSRAINALADHLRQEHESTHTRIERTTADLRESMETIERQNQELDGARRQALEASRVKSEFLANVSHEIRTPLNGIVGFCRLLHRSPLDEHQREWLGHVEQAADNLLSLVNDILDFSKLEAGKLPLDTVELDIAELVDEVLLLEAPGIQNKGLEMLGLVYDDVPSSLLGDPLRIKQVLTNLTHNAVKFTDRGEILVRVQVEADHGSEAVIGVRVSDTGMGLPPEVRQQLFQPFVQGSVSRSTHPGGTGLGLKICKQLLDQMGGAIDVTSEAGTGTTFHATLPLRLGQSGASRAALQDLGGRHIALFEPHGPSRLALRHWLRSAAAEVTILDAPATRETLPDATDLLIEAQPHATLPACERLATLDCAILLLRHGEPDDDPDRLPPRCRTFLKPLTRQRLATALHQLLVDEAPGLTSPPAPLPTAAPEPRRVTARHRVLTVDDIASNRLLVEEWLKHRGVECVSARNGEEALALARAQRFDLVLMDIRLPGMDGIETTTALRRLDEHWANCPIVALTAHALPEDTRALVDTGMQAVLTKPLDVTALDRLLATYLDLPDAPRDDAPAGTDDEELPVVDTDLGTTLAGGRPDLAQRMLDDLLESLDDSEARLRQTYQAGDEEGFLDAVHHLNGACRYCGVPQLALVAETLESRLRAQGIDAVADIHEALLDALQRLRDWRSETTSPAAH